MLLDAKKSREIRYDFETLKDVIEDYKPALINLREMKFYNHSNVAIIETELSKIIKDKNGQIGIKLTVTHLNANSGGVDFLADHGEKWQKIKLTDDSLAFYEMPEYVTVKEGETENVSLRRGLGKMRALIFYPHNPPKSLEDEQFQILKEKLLK